MLHELGCPLCRVSKTVGQPTLGHMYNLISRIYVVKLFLSAMDILNLYFNHREWLMVRFRRAHTHTHTKTIRLGLGNNIVLGKKNRFLDTKMTAKHLKISPCLSESVAHKIASNTKKSSDSGSWTAHIFVWEIMKLSLDLIKAFNTSVDLIQLHTHNKHAQDIYNLSAWFDFLSD